MKLRPDFYSYYKAKNFLISEQIYTLARACLRFPTSLGSQSVDAATSMFDTVPEAAGALLQHLVEAGTIGKLDEDLLKAVGEKSVLTMSS